MKYIGIITSINSGTLLLRLPEGLVSLGNINKVSLSNIEFVSLFFI